MQPKSLGFSLLELLIVLAIITAIMAMAIPLYSSHLIKVRRANASVAINDVANQLEHYHLLHHTYQGATIDQAKLTLLVNSYYRIEVEIINADNYSVYAIPINAQAKDTVCGSLILQANGKREITGNGAISECW